MGKYGCHLQLNDLCLAVMWIVTMVAWRSGSVIHRMNEVTLHWARLVLGWAGIPPRYVTKPTRSTQPCISPGSQNWVPALISWGKGGNFTSAGWQVTLCDPIWHVSFRSGETYLRTATSLLYSFATIIIPTCSPQLYHW